MEFTNKQGIELVDHVIDTVIENRDYLSQIDGEAGDGDHGINMSKGMKFSKKELEEQSDANMSQGFMTISKVLVSKIGGSMGPLYGSFFRGLGAASKKAETIDEQVMAAMLDKAYSNLSGLTDAKPGDKTLIDVLVPAVEAYKEGDKDFAKRLEDMEQAAKEGLESTKNMVAKIGRASRLGERSRGHQDAGATSCYLILKAISDAAMQLIKENN